MTVSVSVYVRDSFIYRKQAPVSALGTSANRQIANLRFWFSDLWTDFLPQTFADLRQKSWNLSQIRKSTTLLAEVEYSRTHFQVLGLGLEASSPWPWPQSLRSSKVALPSARRQHYFLNRWNFVGIRQKPHGKFANTFFVFRNWSIGLAKRASPQLKFHQWQKCDKNPIVSSFSVSF